MLHRKTRKALILNQNAGKVTPELSRELTRQSTPNFNIFLSGSEPEGQEIMKYICSDGYGLVISGGGDDTSRSIVDGFRMYGQGHQPLLAAVKLGTGNGTAHYTGARNPRRDIAALCNAEIEDLPTTEVPLIKVSAVKDDGTLLEPTYFTFAGTGFDALLLGQYEQSAVKGLAGYLAAIPRTLQQIVKDNYPYAQIRASNLKQIIEQEGKIIPVSLFPEGLANLQINSVTVGTTPYFGFGFKALPLAEEAAARGKMHVRLAYGTPFLAGLALINNAVPVWTGTFRGKPLCDCFAEELTVDFPDQPGSLQVAGKSKGLVSSVTYQIDGQVQMVNFGKINRQA